MLLFDSFAKQPFTKYFEGAAEEEEGTWGKKSSAHLSAPPAHIQRDHGFGGFPHSLKWYILKLKVLSQDRRLPLHLPQILTVGPFGVHIAGNSPGQEHLIPVYNSEKNQSETSRTEDKPLVISWNFKVVSLVHSNTNWMYTKQRFCLQGQEWEELSAFRHALLLPFCISSILNCEAASEDV